MNKKIKCITLVITSLFLATGLSHAFDTNISLNGEDKEFSIGKKHITLHFLDPMIKEKDNFIEIEMTGTNTHSYHPGKPVLPLYTTTLNFPFGTKIIDIACTPHTINTKILPNQIIPAPQPVVQGIGKKTLEYEPDETIYSTNSY